MQKIPAVSCFTCGNITSQYWTEYNRLKSLYKTFFDSISSQMGQLNRSSLLDFSRNLVLSLGIITSSNVQSLLDNFDIKFDINNPSLTEDQIVELMSKIGIIKLIDEIINSSSSSNLFEPTNSYEKAIAASLNQLNLVRFCCRKELMNPPLFIPYVEKQAVGQEAILQPFNDLVLERRQKIIDCQHPLYSIFDDGILVELEPNIERNSMASVQMPSLNAASSLPVMPLIPVNVQDAQPVVNQPIPTQLINKIPKRIYRAR
jgi:DNA-directed RNA polymerase subunit N (RpoN/RPB10)